MKTIIIYKSKKAVTKICGEKLRKQIKGDCQMLTFDEVREDVISAADQIVLGTPVYAGMFAKEVKDFLIAYESTLKRKKMFLYICCMNSSLMAQYISTNLTEEQTKLFTMISCVGGAFYFDKMNFMEKLIIKMIQGSENKKKGIKEKVDVKTNVEMYDEVALNALARKIVEI